MVRILYKKVRILHIGFSPTVFHVYWVHRAKGPPGPGFDFFYERAWEKMASENVHVSLLVPNELDAALRALQRGPYSGKPLADIYRLMLWRGLGRTEELLKEREEMGGLAK